MKVGDLVRWKTKPTHQAEWTGLLVKLEEPSFAHVLWNGQNEVWTWVMSKNLEVINEV
jgi:hypothetical protein